MSEDTPEYAVEADSKRLRRLREAVANLPEPWASVNRVDGSSTAVANHLHAIRNRLDWLVELEDRLGDEQRNANRARSERNALIWALLALTPVAQANAMPAPPEPQRRQHSPEYVARVLAECDRAVADGFTVADASRAGVLLHKDGDAIAPVEVPLAVWFYFLGRQEDAHG